MAKSLSSQDSPNLATCHLLATALAHVAVVSVLLQSFPLCTHSGIDCLELSLCDIIIHNVSLFYFTLMLLELLDYMLTPTHTTMPRSIHAFKMKNGILG